MITGLPHVKEPVIKGHLSCRDTFSLILRCPLRQVTEVLLYCVRRCFLLSQELKNVCLVAFKVDNYINVGQGISENKSAQSGYENTPQVAKNLHADILAH